MTRWVRLGSGEYSSPSEIQRAARQFFLDTLVMCYPEILADLREFQPRISEGGFGSYGINAWTVEDFARHWRLDVPWFIEATERTIEAYTPVNGFELPAADTSSSGSGEPVPLVVPEWSLGEETEKTFSLRVRAAVAEYKKRRKADAADTRIRTPRRDVQHFIWLVRYQLDEREPSYADLAREVTHSKVLKVRVPRKADEIRKTIKELSELILLPVREGQTGRPRTRYAGPDSDDLMKRLNDSLARLKGVP